MAESTVKVVFLGDASKLKRELDDVDSSTSKSEGGFGKLGAAIGGLAAAGAITSFATTSVAAATSLGESINAVNKIFGDSSTEILDWGKNNATQFGLSQAAFNSLATPLGALLKNSGLDNIAGQTVDLTKRAADLASVFNVDVSEAMEAINSGLKGEADPLEKFGIGLSAAKVEAQALSDTGKTLAKDLTDQEKAQARINLIMKESASVAGDFTSTAGEYANAQRISAAKTEELQAKLGTKLVPVMQKVTEIKLALVTVLVEKLVPAIERVSPVVQRMGEVVGDVIATVAAWWREHWDQISDTATTIINGVRDVVETVLGAVEAFWRTWGGNITRIVTGVFDGIRQVVQGAMDIVRGIIDVVMGLIRGDFSRVWEGIRALISGVWQVINGLVDTAMAALRGLIEAGMRLIAGVFDAAWAAIRSAIATVIGEIVELARAFPGRAIEAIGDLGGAIWRAIQAGVEWLRDTAIGGAISGIVEFFSAMPGRIVAAVGDLAGAVWGAISGGWNGLRALIEKPIGDAIASILTWVTNLPGQLRNLFSGIYSAATDLGSMLIQGVISGVSGLISTAGDFAGAVVGALKRIINEQVIDRINRALEVNISLGPLGSINLNPPDIPRLAKGGITTGPMLAMIGDNPSGREAVIPLDSRGRPPWATEGRAINIGPFIFNGPVSRADMPRIDTSLRQLMSTQVKIALAGG